MVSESTTLREALAQEDRRIDRRECELLLAHAFDRGRAWVWAHLDDTPVDASALQRFHELVDQRVHGHPIAYLTGRREFYGRDFEVNEAVLIPRPETELLIELALKRNAATPLDVIDIGTGSGAIALTLAAERPAWRVSACDISTEALGVAKRNRSRLQLDRVELFESDLLAKAIDRSFDLIVSNPPYVAGGDPHLAQGDLRFEPAVALSCGDDGLSIIKRLIDQAWGALRTG
ncbi:MAG: peptide chain release factor N(5)-glutamine methyltransferase, partial [Pseudomonadota bacterium]